MKKLTIVAEMPDKAAAALQYGPGHLDDWAEDALRNWLECDCCEPWGEEVERLFGFRAEDVKSAFNVTEARIEDAPGEEAFFLPVELDEGTAALLEKLARNAGMTPKAYLNGPIKNALLKKAEEAAGVALP